MLPLLIRRNSQLVLAPSAQDRYQPFHHEAFLLGEDTLPPPTLSTRFSSAGSIMPEILAQTSLLENWLTRQAVPPSLHTHVKRMSGESVS